MPDTVVQRVLDPAASWAPAVGAVSGGLRLVPHVAVRVRLTFDEAKAGLDHTEELEAILPVNSEPTDLSGLTSVDYDDRDLRSDFPDGAVYVLPEAKITTKTWWTAIERAVKADLYATQNMTVLHNTPLKLWSRPAETREAFEIRCRAVADEREDEEAEKLRAKLEVKADRLRAAIDRAQDKVDQLEADVSTRRSSELVNIGSSILGGFLGRPEVRPGGRRRRPAGRRQARRDQPHEAALGDRPGGRRRGHGGAGGPRGRDGHRSCSTSTTSWMEASNQIEPVEVGLEKTDIQVTNLTLVWVPTARA